MAALLIAKVSLAAERGVEIVLDRRRDPLPRLDPELSADVGTVLGNLVDNAVDATVAAGGERDRRTRRAEERDAVAVRVADTGAGVPEDAAARRVPPRLHHQARRLPAVAVSGWRWCRWSASGGAARVSVHNDAGAVFTAVLPVPGGGAR